MTLTSEWREGRPAQLLRELITRVAAEPVRGGFGAPPLHPDARALEAYVLTGGSDAALASVQQQHLIAAGDEAIYDGAANRRLRELYADLTALPPEVWVRWGTLLAATWQTGLNPNLGPWPLQGADAWPLYLLHQMQVCALDPLPSLQQLEPILREGGLHIGELVGLAFVSPGRIRSWDPTGTARQVLRRMPDYHAVVAHLHDWVVPHLVADPPELHSLQVELLAALDDRVLALFAETLADWSLAGRAAARDRVTPLVRRVGESVGPVLVTGAATGGAAERARALTMLRECGESWAQQARTLAADDRAASVRRLLEEWDHQDQLAAPPSDLAGPSGSTGAAPLPEVSWAVETTPEVEALVTLMGRRFDYARTHGHHRILEIPADYVDRVLDELRSDTRPRQLVDLDEQDVHSTLRDVAGLPAATALQLTAAHYRLKAGSGESQSHVTLLLQSAYERHGGPSLLEAESLLQELADDGSGLLREAMVMRTWRTELLGTGWSAEHVVPWVRRHAAALVAQHDGLADGYYFARSRTFELLAMVEDWPPAVTDWVFDKALSTKTKDRAFAQQALAAHPELTGRRVAALQHRTSGVRAVAADWLARQPDPAALEALEGAVADEKNDPAKAALLGALAALGKPVEDYLDRGEIEESARKEAAKPLPAALRWLESVPLPTVRWRTDGTTLSAELVRWLVVQAVKGKEAAPGPMLAALTSAMDTEDLQRLGDLVLDGWIEASAPGAAKGVVALATLGGGRHSTLRAADFVRTYHGKRAVQSKALLGLLARTADPGAIGELVAIAHDTNAPSIREEATSRIEEAAASRGWTIDELEDRTVPTLGFDQQGRLPLPYGPRTFHAVLAPDLTVTLQGPDGTTVRSLPAARKDDDPDQVAAAKALLKATRRGLTTQAKRQTARLRLALACQRTWSGAAFDRDVLQHPLLRHLAVRCVWIAEGDGTRLVFRPLEDGTLSDVEDEEVTVPPGAEVRLAHGCILSADEREAWDQHLTDYEVEPLLEQTADPLPPLDQATLQGTRLDEARGTRTTAGALHGAAGRHGFERGPVGDGAGVDDYRRELLPLGLTAILDLPVSTYIGDWETEVELGDLEVRRDLTPVRLADLPPVLLDELRRALLALATLDTRTASEDR